MDDTPAAACHALGAARSAGRARVDAVLTRLSDDAPAIASGAAHALGALFAGAPDPPMRVTRALVSTVNEREESAVRSEAVRAIGRIGGAHTAAHVGLLAGCLLDDDARVVRQAMYAIKQNQLSESAAQNMAFEKLVSELDEARPHGGIHWRVSRARAVFKILGKVRTQIDVPTKVPLLTIVVLRVFAQHASHVADQVVALIAHTPTSNNRHTVRHVLRCMEVSSEAYASALAHPADPELDVDDDLAGYWRWERGLSDDEWQDSKTSAADWAENTLKTCAWATHARDYEAELLDHD